MSIFRKATLATLVATASLAAAVPMASAQDAAPDASAQVQQAHGKAGRGPGRDMRGGPHRTQRGMMAMPLVSLTCAPNAAERLETRYDRIGERLDLTDEQATLFDALKTEALTAQTSFADDCPTPPAAKDRQASRQSRGNPIDRLEQRLERDGDRIAALTGLLPELRAFYDSLDENQLAKLRPNRMQRDGKNKRHHRS
ncbi:Spy/CpxP family protein refolding chaperone [Devosia sp.]|uniref:Spy/CpxP family protein refolding chaperone n=1 Tax=Devosia sp. TaxID=1871048 RepID=UPI003A91A9D7